MDITKTDVNMKLMSVISGVVALVVTATSTKWWKLGLELVQHWTTDSFCKHFHTVTKWRFHKDEYKLTPGCYREQVKSFNILVYFEIALVKQFGHKWLINAGKYISWMFHINKQRCLYLLASSSNSSKQSPTQTNDVMPCCTSGNVVRRTALLYNRRSCRVFDKIC